MMTLRIWWARLTNARWQWGHPDDWSDVEWEAYRREERRLDRRTRWRERMGG